MIRLDLDMPMPDGCIKCPLCHDYSNCRAKGIWFGKEDDWIYETRPNWCPLQEVPDPERGGGENRCVCCGAIIPEGRQVCPQCIKFSDALSEEHMEKKYEIFSDCMFDREYGKYVPTMYLCGCCHAKVNKTDTMCWHCRSKLYFKDLENDDLTKLR